MAIKIVGKGSEKLLALVLALLTDKNKASGKVWLSTMLKNGNELKVIAVKESELATFSKEAGKFGIQFAVLKDKKANDGITDVMVNAKDIALVSRVFDRFKLTHVDLNDVGQTLKENKDGTEQKKVLTPNEELDQFIASIVPASKDKEAAKPNPTDGPTAWSRQSGPKSKETETQSLSKAIEDTRPSVKKELDELVKAEEKYDKPKAKTKSKNRSGKSPKKGPEKGAR
ncbi:MAG: PcfB family protein [Firmicutes bacterium]|nr:PcfB family protein [Bacillota bacterium]